MLYNNDSSLVLRGKEVHHTRLIVLLIGFSFAYALLEYYIIRDPSFGYPPILFSLVYPYHLVMATAIALFSYWLVNSYHYNDVRKLSVVAIIFLTAVLFTIIITIEDFLWFTIRAIAPYQGDINAGRLIIQGEWTTQFFGSTDTYFTAIPNWYFISPLLTMAYVLMIKCRNRLLTKATPANA